MWRDNREDFWREVDPATFTVPPLSTMRILTGVSLRVMAWAIYTLFFPRRLVSAAISLTDEKAKEFAAASRKLDDVDGRLDFV